MMSHVTHSPRADAALLVEQVRVRLRSLGDYAHLHVRAHGKHILIEQPGPPDDVDDRDAVMRLTAIGAARFGVSLHRHTGKWEHLPLSGPLDDVLAEAVRTLGPWLELDPDIPSTSGTDY